MKLSLTLLFSWSCLVGYGQIYNYNPTTAYFMDRVKIASNEDSKIEIRHRDTVLIARFEYINPQNQARQFSEKVYLGTPYWRNGWFSTSLELPQGKPIRGIMAYNLHQQKVYFSTTPEKAAQEVKPGRFTLLGTTFDLGPDERFYEVIAQAGSWKGLKKHFCEYAPLKPAERTGYEISGGEFEGEFKKKVTYFIQYKDKIIRIRRGGKWVRELDEFREPVEAYLKKTGGNLEQDNQLKAFILAVGSLPSN